MAARHKNWGGKIAYLPPQFNNWGGIGRPCSIGSAVTGFSLLFRFYAVRWTKLAISSAFERTLIDRIVSYHVVFDMRADRQTDIYHADRNTSPITQRRSKKCN